MASESVRDAEAAPEEIRWRVHPLVEDAWRSLLLAVIIVVVCIAAWLFTGWPGMALLALLILVGSMAPYVFPTRYRVDSDGIEIVFLGVRAFREWEEFRNFYPHDVGVHLSTFKRPSRLDAFRGSFIRFAPGNREEVLRFLDAHIKRERKEPEKPPETAAEEGETEEK